MRIWLHEGRCLVRNRNTDWFEGGLTSCRCLVARPFPEILRRLSRRRLDSVFSQLCGSAWWTAPPSLLTLSTGNITENNFLLQRTAVLCCFFQLQKKKAQKVTPLSPLSECWTIWQQDLTPRPPRHHSPLERQEQTHTQRKKKKKKRLEAGRKFPLLSSCDRSPGLVSLWREQKRCRLNFAWF